MQASRWERYAPLTGIVFLALVIPSIFIPGDTPDNDDPLPKVVHYWSTHDTRAIVSSLLGAIAVIFFLWFLGSLRSALRSAEGGNGRLSAVVFAGGIVLAAGAAVGTSFQFIAADTVGDVPGQVTQTFSVLNNDFFLPFPIGIGTMLLATGVVSVRTGVFPRWLGWVTIVLGIAVLTPVGFIAFLVWLLWVLVVSVLLFLASGAAAPAEAAPPPPAGVG